MKKFFTKNRLVIAIGVGLLAATAGAHAFSLFSVKDPAFSKESAIALALLKSTPIREGRNGYASLFTFTRDIPLAIQEGVVLDAVRQYEWQKVMNERPTNHEKWKTYPDISMDSKDAHPQCHQKDTVACLEKVRAAAPGYVSVVNRHDKVLDRALALSEYDYFASPFPVSAGIMTPEMKDLGYLPTAAATWFVSGQKERGMDAACKGIRLGYNLVSGSQTLVENVVGASLMSNASKVLGQMIDEEPAQALPESCQALAGLQVSAPDLVCNALLNEGRFVLLKTSESFQHKDADTNANADILNASQPRHFGRFCDAQSKQEIAAGTPRTPRVPATIRELNPLVCVASSDTCLIDELAVPSYNNYAVRIQEGLATFNTVLGAIRARAKPTKGS